MMHQPVYRPAWRSVVSIWLAGLLVLLVAANGGPTPSAAASTVSLVPVASGFSSPVYVGHANDGSGRLFVVEQGGRIKIIKNGTALATPFLNISSRISLSSERGLLGVAFPPGYASKHHFYVYYTSAGGGGLSTGDIVVARYGLTGDPDVADPNSEQIVLTVPHSSQSNHNGGQLAFSPQDGLLYIGTGDGGGGGDLPNNAQNLDVWLGKILRIDVETSNPTTYTNPPGNLRGPIWDYGLRNPWRFSFDRQTHDLYIGDVGQNQWEEIDFEPPGQGQRNYGWHIMEGNHCYNPSTGCPTAGLTLPVWEYDHTGGNCAVIGGFVYRGATYPTMRGRYFYGDYCSGNVWSFQMVNGTAVSQQVEIVSGPRMQAFGENELGELFLAGADGTIYQIVSSVKATPHKCYLPFVDKN